MGNTTLTHKLRNPKDLSKWLDIWTADVANANNYTITPSEHWEIPANQIIDHSYTPEPTQDNPNPDPITEKNTTIENPEGGHIAITNSDGSIREGAAIDPENGSSTKFLNEKGNWVYDDNYLLRTQSFSLEGETLGGALLFSTMRNNQTVTSNSIPIIGASDGPIVTTAATLQGGYPCIYIKIKNKSIKKIMLADNIITPEKIDWDYEDDTDPNNPVTMASTIKDNIGLNSSTNDGIVPATGGASAAGKIWSADAEGNPGWNDFSNTQWNKATDESLAASKIDTQLLGAVIRIDEPTKKITNSSTQIVFPTKNSVPVIGVQKTGAVLNDTRYTVSIDTQFSMSLTNNDTEIDLKMKTVNSWTVSISNDRYVVTPSYTTTTLKTFSRNDILPDIYLLADKWFNYFMSEYNNQATGSPKRIAQNDYTSIKTTAINNVRQNYLDILETTSESTTTITDYATIVVTEEGDYNNWDWNHLGIWIEI